MRQRGHPDTPKTRLEAKTVRQDTRGDQREGGMGMLERGGGVVAEEQPG